ncbi:phosphatase [Streptomyces sp. Ru71]|uniref:ATP-binding SpoIIE family protein phosphatase n=1 Tax=Streptomyces sp. Ru71 TaxID=2080746 RepID=UPI000CDD87FB|nr:SpoIIE family protein phosphatase [Streptomyces sp. Ru71]POX51667.1 phosphatase [Streptomyces sp. Ru71]
MGIDVDAFLRRLAQELRPRAEESADLLLQRLAVDMPELWEHEEIAALALEETASHITRFLDVLEQRIDVTDVDAPPEALEIARQAARHGVPLSRLLRSYRLGHMILVQLIQGEAARLTDDWELMNAAAMRLVGAAFRYVDRGSEQVVAAYQEERDRRLQRRLLLANEASRRIGTSLDTARTAQELTEFGTEDFADLVTVDLLDSLLHDGDDRPPAPSARTPVLRRIAQRSVLDDGAGPPVATGRTHTYPAESEPARALASGRPRLHRPTAPASGHHSALLLPLRARGNTLGLAQFLRSGTATPFDDDDLLLAQEIAALAAVSIDNARRYSQERTTALTLQRSLLPQRAVEQSAVDTASRYLPSGARAGVGGDWYDVIPLSGARVALVVGDVVGRGLHAAATMGRLRTAVRSFADIDLMPDELLTHLDDVVIRLQREEARDVGELSATCLYAVYDPVSRLCTLASAGHVAPAVATPPDAPGVDATWSVDFPEMPIGPPLGLGGLPFETAQFELAEGSLLTLYTDGLIQSRGRDVDAARAALCDAVTDGPATPEEICDRLLAAVLPDDRSDDVALLVARTRALDPGHVTTLDLPSDPAAVAGARARTVETLTAWGLEELSFATELIVSELVTNAIRYGKGPIQLRLILQSTLTCEVFDTNSTSPHLRRARTFDEGGRGLLLVAQLAERWGTRHSREGKVIWAEQALPAEPHGTLG